MSSPPSQHLRQPFEYTTTRTGGVAPMKYQTITNERHGAVARIITNGPRYQNAQSRPMIDELDHAFAARLISRRSAMKPIGTAPPYLHVGCTAFLACLMLGTPCSALFAIDIPTVPHSSAVRARALTPGPEAVDWASLPVQQWTRLPTTGEAPRKVFH